MDKAKQSYNAQLTAGGLLLPESRKIARLMIDDVQGEAWDKALYEDNILQKRTHASSKRISRLIRSRLELINPALWQYVVDGDRELACQVLLIAIIKHSRILGDFMLNVMREAIMSFKDSLSRKDWEAFLLVCEQGSSEVAKWSAQTRKKVGTTVFRILEECGYLENTRSLHLTTVILRSEVKTYLKENSEDYVYRCMDLTK